MRRPQNQTLAAAVAALGLSKRELADAAGINPVTLWRVSTGLCKPSKQVATAIARTLNLDVPLLFPELSNRHPRTRRSLALEPHGRGKEADNV